MKHQILVVLLLFSLTLAEEQSYRKVIHNTDPEAKCLDGSPAGLYVHEGGDKSSILMYFVGGGACGEQNLGDTVESCYQRSKTQLGSSKLWPDTITVGGYLSTDSTKSAFANWTKLVFIYCDGSLHQGLTRAPLQYKDALLYFRGAAITRSHFKYINATYGLADAKAVVLTGGSAGGIATFLWQNYLKTIVKNPLAVLSIPDSGVFLNVESMQTKTLKSQFQLQNLYKVANKDEKTPIQLCNRKYPDNEYKCLFLQYAFGALQGRTLLINSQYDSWVINNSIDAKCATRIPSGAYTLTTCDQTQMSAIETYRKQYLDFVYNFMQFSYNSIWTVSCSAHVYAVYETLYNANEQRVPESTGLTIKDAIERFVFKGERIAQIDSVAWPNNKACSQ